VRRRLPENTDVGCRFTLKTAVSRIRVAKARAPSVESFHIFESSIPQSMEVFPYPAKLSVHRSPQGRMAIGGYL
jgi:hypothetical protein